MQRDLDEAARALVLAGRLLAIADSLPEDVAEDVLDLISIMHVRFSRLFDGPLGERSSLEGAHSQPQEGEPSQPEVRAAAA